MVKLDWKKTRGTQEAKPQTVDETSSRSVIYLRRNIERKTVTNGTESVKVWEYEEAQLTPGEYAEYRAALAQLESPAMEQLKADNAMLLSALADIYERVEAQEEQQLYIMAALADIYENTAQEESEV